MKQVLCAPREADKLREDVLKMRGEMAEHKSPKGPLDAKLLRGGLVDLEFLVHFLQLRDGIGITPDLGEAIGVLSDAELLAAKLKQANALLTRVLVTCRLVAPSLEVPTPAAGRALARACGAEDMASLQQQFTDARALVASEWHRIFDVQLEI